jgi:hypothetical protein
MPSSTVAAANSPHAELEVHHEFAYSHPHAFWIDSLPSDCLFAAFVPGLGNMSSAYCRVSCQGQVTVAMSVCSCISVQDGSGSLLGGISWCCGWQTWESFVLS